VEEAVNRLRGVVTHARHRSEGVGAGAKVTLLAQELERVLLGLNRVRLGIIDEAEHRDRLSLDLERLALALARHQRPGRRDRRPRREVEDLGGVVGQGAGHDQLDGIVAAAVRQVDEREPRLRVAAGSHPTPHFDLRSD
jgi:hypothetical protein